MKKEIRYQKSEIREKEEGRRLNILYFVLWMNDNEMIYDAGLGCENESIGQGRSLNPP